MIVRTYQCDDCKAMFEVTHESGNDPFPDCPRCNTVLEWRPQRIAIGGSHESKAVDYAQTIMEQDFGLGNFKDNNREGDVGYIDPLRKTAAEMDAQGQRDSEIGRAIVEKFSVPAQDQAKVDGFFGGQTVKIGQNSIPVQQMIAMGKSGPGVTDPMALFHSGIKSGKVPKVQTNIMARADMSGKIVK